jgi:two-component system cell cycle sensor histidine kinase/response regulator CckA
VEGLNGIVVVSDSRIGDGWYRSLVAFSADAIALLGADGEILFATPPVERLTGYRPAELIGTSAFDSIHPDDLDRVRESFQRVLAVDEPVHVEYRARHKDGSWRLRDCVGINRLEDRAVGAVVVNYRDTSAGSIADAALLERHRWTSEQLRAVISAVPIVLWAIDRDGIVTLSEGSLLRHIGLQPGEAVGRSIFDMYSAVPEILEFTRAALRGETPRWTIEIQGRTFSGCYTAMRNAANRLTGAIGVATDVSDRVHLEQRLLQTAKMEAVGRLAGGIAHDFNNYLTAIISYAELALDQAGANGSLRRDLEEVRKAGASAASLTRQLLAFSRQQLLQPQILDLNTIVSGMSGMLRRLIGEDIDLRSIAGDALGRISADHGQIEQVIMNLALNARDAMPHGGVLTIETGNIDLDARFTADHPGASTGPHVMLAISDTGAGMDQTVREHLFEPFYTTKAAGRGIGLGLATVYGIVKQSGGSIFVYSEINRGTTFKIFLPRSDHAAEQPLNIAGSTAALHGGETILVVEDHPEVLAVAHYALSRYGYRVLTAADGTEALAVAKAHGEPIDLLITDVVMPGVSARELVDRFRDDHPRAGVIYMSGYTNDNVVQRGILEHTVAFLQKPFSPQTLVRKVRQVLDGQR